MENKQYTTRELFRRFAPYFKKYRFTLCIVYSPLLLNSFLIISINVSYKYFPSP